MKIVASRHTRATGKFVRLITHRDNIECRQQLDKKTRIDLAKIGRCTVCGAKMHGKSICDHS